MSSRRELSLILASLFKWNKFCQGYTSFLLKTFRQPEGKRYLWENKVISYNSYLLGLAPITNPLNIFFPSLDLINQHWSTFMEDVCHNIQNGIRFRKRLLNGWEKYWAKEFKIYELTEIRIQKGLLEIYYENNGLQMRSFPFPPRYFQVLQKQYIPRGDLDVPDFDQDALNLEELAEVAICYSYYGSKMVGTCLSAEKIYRALDPILTGLNVTEVFAGPLNNNDPFIEEMEMEMETDRRWNWCSLFPLVDAKFGSKGSFFLTELSSSDVILAGPPYHMSIMTLASQRILDFQGLAIVVIPDWRRRDTVSDPLILSTKAVQQIYQETDYPAYQILRASPHFRFGICLGGFLFSTLEGTQREYAKGNTLILVLDTDPERSQKVQAVLKAALLE